jgi:ABC-type antimicrobial peptide transport system permease subunit
VEGRFAQAQLYLRLLAALAFIAITIAAAGIDAVLAHGVAQRTPELGLRMALGARPGQLLRVVLSRALVLTAIGAAVGSGLAIAAARVVRANIFDVAPADPLVVGAAVCGILLVALGAAAVPALRALRVDPAEVLRAN